MVSYKTDLPTMEELEHPSINFSGNILKAGAFQLGKYCENQNDEFMLCRQELGPRYCLKEGKEVTNCTLEFFGKLKKFCYHELDRYAHCVEKSSADLSLLPCKKTQAAFDRCIFDNMNIKRPEFAYYTRPKIYQSTRPAPEKQVQVFDDIPIAPEGPDFPPSEKAKYGTRIFAFK